MQQLARRMFASRTSYSKIVSSRPNAKCIRGQVWSHHWRMAPAVRVSNSHSRGRGTESYETPHNIHQGTWGRNVPVMQTFRGSPQDSIAKKEEAHLGWCLAESTIELVDGTLEKASSVLSSYHPSAVVRGGTSDSSVKEKTEQYRTKPQLEMWAQPKKATEVGHTLVSVQI